MRLTKITADLDALVTTAGQMAEFPLARRLSTIWRLRRSLRRPLVDHMPGSRRPAVSRRALHRSVSSFDPVPEDVAVVSHLFSAAVERSLYRKFQHVPCGQPPTGIASPSAGTDPS
jgi:hypothetical protein